MGINDLEPIIQKSLTSFCQNVFDSKWFGKEREAVSLYTFGFLLKECSESSIFKDPTQIGIEVRVPSIKNVNIKKEVCKDLVIWAKGAQSCWNILDSTYNYPIAILEWKTNVTEIDKNDLNWMIEYSKNNLNFIGFVISLDLKKRKFKMKVIKVCNGVTFENWLLIK